MHLVCTLGDNRKSLQEYKDLSALKFEVQIRTALQHAWAELVHDQIYKDPRRLPAELERKVYLLSAHLETADDILSSLINRIAKVRADSNEKPLDKLLLEEIDSINLPIFLKKYLAQKNIVFDNEQNKMSDYTTMLNNFDELQIKYLSDLNSILDELNLSTLEKEADQKKINSLLDAVCIVRNPKPCMEDMLRHVGDDRSFLYECLSSGRYHAMAYLKEERRKEFLELLKNKSS